MLELQRLSLAGFKSFADPTELYFGTGMTGVVGPNGCGKSNILEALRWVMGESRAKALRGDELEDVIFSGTTLRPARGLAEVRLTFANPDMDAPAPYTEQPTIEIVRTVTRASGSSYKINGRPVRARDVHLFLNEANTGSSSPAFVTQGQVAALISAKPEARREMIEETAGISGLYLRRREAEQRLNAASGNLTRVQDIMHGLNAQIETLAVQAADARKYTDLSNTIQQLEAAIAHREWTRLRDALHSAQAALTQKLEAKNSAEAALAMLEAEQETQRESLSGRRRAEDEARAALAAVENEAVRLTERLAAREREITMLQTQIAGFDGQDAQLRAQLEKLVSEATILHDDRAAKQKILESHEETLAKLKAARTNTAEALKQAETNVDVARAKMSAARAEAEAQEAERNRVKSRLDTVTNDLTNAAATLREATSGDNGAVFLEARSIEEEITAIEARQREFLERETTLTMEDNSLTAQVETLRPQRSMSEKAIAALEAEFALLQKALGDVPADTALGALRVADGYDRALAVALGEAAQAGLADTTDLYWAETADEAGLPELPKNVTSIAQYVSGAPQLSRLLAMVGVAKDDSDAAKAAKTLAPGQMVVTKSGALWRWDGLRVKDSHVPVAAQTLEQRSRAKTLEKQIVKDSAAIEQLIALETALEEERTTWRAKRADLTAAKNKDIAREQELQGRLRKCNQRIQEQEIKLAGLRTRLATLDEERARLEERMKELAPKEVSETLSPFDVIVNDALSARTHAQEADEQARAALSEADTQTRMAAQEIEQQTRTLARINADQKTTETTLETRSAEKEAATARHVELTAEQVELAESQKGLADLREQKAAALQIIANDNIKAFESLRDCEARFASAQKDARSTYESWVDAGAKVQTLQTNFEELAIDIESRFGVTDPTALPLAYPAPDGDAGSWNSRRATLVDEREALGLINMKAPEEYDATKDQYDMLDRERTDLAQAITELSGTIERINKDARERLTHTVDSINTMFEPLFVKLFGGGTATLAWTKADDILQAGVEIMAQPPGKKLQSLSLLSGGEQALTAIALILSMVKTNPAPLCVFDEIDAALDESNVDRVSQALVELAVDTGARLIVVSHHRLMMSRMDRLYGVTMAERGVSKLVSVDLRREPQLFEGTDGAQNTQASA